MTYQIAAIVGSISPQSINRALLGGIVPLAAEAGLELEELPLAPVPMYRIDVEASIPPEVSRFKAAIEAADGVIFVTPEYNRSIPGVLKNAIDWASRPWGKNSLAGKPAAIIGASGGSLGTALAQRHLRDVLSFLDVRLVNQPELYVQFRDGLIGPDGTIADATTAGLIRQWLAAFRDLLDHRA